MNLPKQYQWLETLKGKPRTIKLSLAEYGVKEVVGKGDSATIMAWRDELNQNGVVISGYAHDSVPWCGLLTAIVCYRRMGVASEVPKSPLWARNWTKYGVKADKPSLGDVLVFSRGSGGHVGFYVGEDVTCYHVLGGNQSDKVCITRISKDRLLAARRPPYKTTPKAVRPFRLAAEGSISTNEA